MQRTRAHDSSPTDRWDSPQRIALLLGGAAALLGGLAYTMMLRAENARLLEEIRALRAGGSNAGAATAAATATGGGAPGAGAAAWSLAADQREAMLARLRAETAPERAIWFATSGDADARAFQRVLQGVFEEAGWAVRGNATPPFAIKPGLYVFVADDEGPAWVEAALGALGVAVPDLVTGRGYLDYYRDMKATNPSWAGFDLAPDQSYVVVVGPRTAR